MQVLEPQGQDTTEVERLLRAAAASRRLFGLALMALQGHTVAVPLRSGPWLNAVKHNGFVRFWVSAGPFDVGGTEILEEYGP